MPKTKKRVDENSTPAQYMDFLTFQMEKYCQVREQFFSTKFNLTPAEFRCLRTVKEGSTITTKELAHQMKLSPGRITHLLTSLEKKNLVLRTVDERDRRSVNVSLTENAYGFLDKVLVEYARLHNDIIKHLPDETQIESLAAIQVFFTAVQNWAEAI